MRNRLTEIALVFLGLMVSGCVTFYKKSETIRPAEERMAVEFESEEAARQFHQGMKKHDRNRENRTYVGVPFVTFFSKTSVLSENAFYNEQLKICDTNRDGFISEAEASIYAHVP